MKFWAGLGSRGCREKNLPTAISMQLFGVVFSTFCGQIGFLIFKKYFSIRTEKLHSFSYQIQWYLNSSVSINMYYLSHKLGNAGHKKIL